MSLVESDTVPLAQPFLNGRELELVGEVLRSGRLSLGPMRERFEQMFAELVGVEHAVAVSSGTAGLHVAAMTAGWGPRDEVVMSPLAVAAAANVTRSTGAAVRFADVRAETFDLDPAAVDAAVSARTRGVVAVDACGWPCDLAAIGVVAKRHGLVVVEDAGTALGALRGGRPVGAGSPWSTVFAFSADKLLTTGEGGMVCTDDAAIATRWRAMVDQQSFGDVAGVPLEPFGVNVRLSDVASAIGVGQLERLGQTMAMRRQVAADYERLLRRTAGVTTPLDAVGRDERAWGGYSVLLDADVDRDVVLVRLAEHGIECGPTFPGLPAHPLYGELGVRAGMFPVAEAVAARSLSLPFSPVLSPHQQARVVEALQDVLAAG
ncbi:MAG: Glutamine--scyllo-inositol transaminase [Thermoleophilia bacterium]|nr:Glutamine--scyllo-inositol transaminase [Thermoleophilia bacterium]